MAMDLGATASHMRRSLSCQVVVVLGALSLLTACGKEAPKPAPAPLEVSVVTVKPGNIDISREYVAQTQSSQAVNIQARVSGFLDKRVYTEGAVVKDGPGAVPDGPETVPGAGRRGQGRAPAQQAALRSPQQNLDRTKPLAQQNALSQKDLDDAQGQYEQAAAAVEQSKAQVETAKLNSLTRPSRRRSTGVAATRRGRRHLPQSAERQLTTVSVLTPMWVNFSISENEMERIRNDVRQGPAQAAPKAAVRRRDRAGRRHVFPVHGHDHVSRTRRTTRQTGTFLVRASVDNPKGVLRPNQYVRARLHGAIRPNAILVPQRAVQQGAKGISSGS